MALVKMKDLLKRAEEKNIGCGAFSVGNMEMVKGAIRAAEELNTPIILQEFPASSDGTDDGAGCKRSQGGCGCPSGSRPYF